MDITNTTKFSKTSDKFLASEVDGEMVLMNTTNGRYLGMNSVTTDIWDLLSEDVNFGNIIERLMQEYDVDKTTCTNQTSGVLKMMHKIELIKIEN